MKRDQSIIKKSEVPNNPPKRLSYGLNKRVKFFNFFIPPFIAIFSLILFSSSFIYFYNPFENIEKKELKILNKEQLAS